MRISLFRFIFCFVFAANLSLFSAQQQKPNILLIMADDLGFSDIGCYGGEIQTPNLDRLAREGLRFTQFYNTTRCWPSRAAILSGYYAQQIRRDTVPGIPSGGNGKRPNWAILLPEMLKNYGYRSYHSGKWHIDGPVLEAGFDRSYALYDHDRKFYPKNHTLDDQKLPPVKETDGYYTSTAVANYAIDFLSEHQTNHNDKPFFLFLAFTEPHFPLQALPQDIEIYKDRYLSGWDVLRQERYKRIKKLGLANCGLPGLDSNIFPAWNLPEKKMIEIFGNGECGRAIPWKELTPEQKAYQPIKMAVHAAMVHRMDIEIGRVLEKVRSMGVFDNTVIFFLSDNGASAEMIVRGDGHDTNAAPGSAKTFLSLGPGWSSAANTPFRLHKSWVHEGGISTPFIIRWGDKITLERGKIRTNPAHIIDFVPTVLDIVSGNPEPPIKRPDAPPLPGKSLVPVLAHDNSVSHNYLWWFHEKSKAIRVGDWKLVCDRTNGWELYNIKKDRAESKNLASKYPEKVTELNDKWESILNQFIADASKDLKGRNKK
ncbi:MAG: arylsulfatase [Verrucomicrobiia bacterium]